MIVKLLAIAFVLAATIEGDAAAAPNPQLLKYEDGVFKVNFLGYHAQAGLGGLLTGNAAHGGLQASAGTPNGQNAGAGLFGRSGTGNSQGTLYAHANSNDRRAGTFLSGTTGQNGNGATIVRGSEKGYATYPSPPVVADSQPDNSVVSFIPLRGSRSKRSSQQQHRRTRYHSKSAQ